MPMPTPRGPVSGCLIAALEDPLRSRDDLHLAVDDAVTATVDILADDDLQLALTLLYELHLRGIEGIDDAAEWDVDLLAVRAQIEQHVGAALDDLVGSVDDPGDVTQALFRTGESSDGPPLAKYMARSATIEQFREVVIHRSLNQLREADVHTFAIPRLHGRAKAGLIEVQMDEYGGGRLDYMHATLYAALMRGLGLNSEYAHYLNAIPVRTLTAVNVLSYFGLHRSRIHELIGHLCVVEMTSAIPSREYSRGLRRLGIGADARIFFDEHVEADSVHEQLIVREVAGTLGTTPEARIGLLRGALICSAVEGLATRHIWDSWEDGRSSLIPVDA
ncbi:iron-containing redox enzyme family protein [Gordonia zhaorongruii]|uniref:iron-containing redox enzyme family protein n=1 Tax=Gordonia zhaorongruii TaxID=2597659 RepID=UPI0010455102